MEAHYQSQYPLSRSAVMQVNAYLNDIIAHRDSGESWWEDERGNIHSADVGYGIQFVSLLMDELERMVGITPPRGIMERFYDYS